MATTTISLDLRKYGVRGANSNFGLNDICFSPEQDVLKQRVPKIIVIEKQPKYPIYGAAIGNLADNLKEFALNSIKGLAGESVKGITGFAAQYGGKTLANRAVSNTNPDAYWNNSNQTYLDRLKNLFTVDNVAGIKTYEMPFFSEYFIDANGDQGWERGGAEAMLGAAAETLETYASVGYPTTPNFRYNPYYQTVNFSFHLINQTSSDLNKNLKFLMTIMPGMMMVLINNVNVASSLDKSVINQVASDVSSLFKSPNVYEVMVPGRFRWLWSTMQMEVSCVGKIFSDPSISGIMKAYTDQNVVGMPEAFKVDVTLRSLLPQTFNEFFFYTTQNSYGGFSGTDIAYNKEKYNATYKSTGDGVNTDIYREENLNKNIAENQQVINDQTARSVMRALGFNDYSTAPLPIQFGQQSEFSNVRSD